MDLQLLLNDLARDCPWFRSKPRKYEARCGVRYTDLELERPKIDKPPERSAKPRMGVTRLSGLVGPVLEVECTWCKRHGAYRVSGLLEATETCLSRS